MSTSAILVMVPLLEEFVWRWLEKASTSCAKLPQQAVVPSVAVCLHPDPSKSMQRYLIALTRENPTYELEISLGGKIQTHCTFQHSLESRQRNQLDVDSSHFQAPQTSSFPVEICLKFHEVRVRDRTCV